MGTDRGRCGACGAAGAFESRTMDLGRCRRAAGGDRGGDVVQDAGAGRVRAAALHRAAAGERTVLLPTWVSSTTPVISPDGRTLAFVATVENQTRIWIRPLDSDASRVLAGTEGVVQPPFWSPDSRSLAFFAESKLKRIAIAGGPPQTICDVPAGAGSGSWGSKGDIVFGFGHELSRVSADGGAISVIRKPDTSKDEVGVVLPEFLPDGDRFFYLAGVRSQKAIVSTSVRSVPPRARSSSKQTRQMVHASPGHVMYVRERTLLAQRFDDRSGRLEGDASPIAENVDYFSPIGIAGFSVSSTGVLAYHASDSIGAVHLDHACRRSDRHGRGSSRVPNHSLVARRQAARIRSRPSRGPMPPTCTSSTSMRGTDTRVTSAGGSEFAPIWSPDGRRLVFTWDNNAPPFLHQLVLDNGTPAEPLVQPSESVYTPEIGIPTEPSSRTKRAMPSRRRICGFFR